MSLKQVKKKVILLKAGVSITLFNCNGPLSKIILKQRKELESRLSLYKVHAMQAWELSSIPSNYIKKLGVVAYAYNPNTGEIEKRCSLGLTGQPA